MEKIQALWSFETSQLFSERERAALRKLIEAAQEIATDALRIHGGNGFTSEYPVERYYRDTPLMIIGEGTSEIQKMVIARQLLARHGID